VVATDCDFGPREIVQHDDSGLLVPVENAAALGVAITSILDDRTLSTRLSEGARRRAGDFDVVHMVRAYEDLFREVRRGTP
jgi:glycosyltransferase involved in cell wall biosynthesis